MLISGNVVLDTASPRSCHLNIRSDRNDDEMTQIYPFALMKTGPGDSLNTVGTIRDLKILQ